jgi:hypothetical protein
MCGISFDTIVALLTSLTGIFLLNVIPIRHLQKFCSNRRAITLPKERQNQSKSLQFGKLRSYFLHLKK